MVRKYDGFSIGEVDGAGVSILAVKQRRRGGHYAKRR